MKKINLIRRLTEEQDNFFSSVFLVVLLPLLPLLLEFWSTNTLPGASSALTASFFALALGSSSKVKSFFALSIVLGVLFAAAYIIALNKINIDKIQNYSYLSIATCAILHIYERYIRHVEDKDTFLDLWYGKEDVDRKKIRISELEGKKNYLRNEIKNNKDDLHHLYDELKVSTENKEEVKTNNTNEEINRVICEIKSKEKECKEINEEISKLKKEAH